MRTMTSLRPIFFLSSLIITSVHLIFAQSINSTFERITIKDGLSQSTVNHIIQDKNGFIWFATYGGLNRYDGYSFKVYNHNEDDSTSINNDGIIFLFEDNEGFIWVVNHGKAGLNKFDPKTEKFVSYRNDPNDTTSISSNDIQSVMQDKAGNIWICAKNAFNLVVYNKDKNGVKTQFKRIAPPANNVEFKMAYEDNRGNLLVFATTFYYFNRQTNKFTNSGLRVTSNGVITICEDKAGNIYVASDVEGITKLTWNKDLSKYEIADPGKLNVAPNNRVCMIIDDNDQFWIGTETKGLYRYNPKKDELVNFMYDDMNPKSLSDNRVYSLFIDRFGTLWIGTYSQGLCKYDLYKKEFIHFKSVSGDENSLSSNLISAIHSNNSNELWVSIQTEGGVNRIIFNGSEVTNVIHYKNEPNNNNSIAGNSTLSLVQRKNGTVWVGDRGNFISKIIPEVPGSDNPHVITRYASQGWTFTLFEDSKGILWGGTWGNGLWRFDDTTEEFIRYHNDTSNKSSLNDNIVWSIGEDIYGNIWLGGQTEGISILPVSEKNKPSPKFVHFEYDKKNPYSIGNNTINAFCLDKEGTMWIGTNNGLSKLMSSKDSLKNLNQSSKLEFFTFQKKHGLPSDAVIGVVEDHFGNIWMSTTNGISKFNRKDSTFTNFYESDGLQSNEFWHNAYFINSEGRIFFGGSNGFNAFYPENIKPNPFLPKVVFTDLKVLNKSVKIGEKVNNQVILSRPIYETSEITLSHKNNVITFEFAALHYTQPLSNQYAYFLEGFDNDWNYSGNQRTATYTNLNPGKYILRIKGSNSDGNWSEIEATIKIKVKPPWWKTWLFRILMIGAIIFVINKIVRQRIAATKRDKLTLQSKIKEGELELQKKKEEIEKQKKEILEKENSAMETNWYNKGMTMITDVISKNNNNLSLMASKVISALIDYLGANIGAFYILNKSDDQEPFFELAGSYAVDENRMNNTYSIGDGYLGSCYLEKKKIIINNLPEEYIKLESGLGQISISNLILMPLLLENDLKGVIELASIDILADYKIALLEKLAENLASSIEIVQINNRMKKMVEQLNLHAEEINSQKEEMHQNLEEMLATQEESERIRDAQRKRESELLKQNDLLKQAKEELKKLQESYNELQSKYQKLTKS